MPFVQAKCPNCGGFLAVDNAKDAAICQFCGTPFIVEKAINNYNITVSGDIKLDSATVKVEGAPNVKSLLVRANSFFSTRNYPKALEYYNRVLDLDPYNRLAKEKVSEITVPRLDNLVVSREKSSIGKRVGIIVYVDGVDNGIVYNGETIHTMISIGQHIITFSELNAGPMEIVIPSGLQYAHFIIKPGWHSWDIVGKVYDFEKRYNND